MVMNPYTNQVPNWFIYIQMDNCDYCELLAPNVDSLALEFHHPLAQENYIVASLNCSDEAAFYMCRYFHVPSVLPKFIVLRPESGNRFFWFPLAYRKNPDNLKKFAVEKWKEAYT